MDERKLEAATDELETELRRIGIYTNRTDVLPAADGTLLLVVDASVGDIAFSDRVHDPDAHEVDSQFKGMMREQAKTDMEELREEMRQKAARGENIFDDDDEEDEDLP